MPKHTPADAAPVIVIDLQTDMFDGAAQPPIHDAADLVARARSGDGMGPTHAAADRLRSS